MTVKNLGPCRCCGGKISTACCPDDPVPRTLHGTISGLTGGCACANGDFTLIYNPAVHGWEILFPVCGDGTNPAFFRLGDTCTLFTTSFFPDGSVDGITECDATTVDCDPFSVTFSPKGNAEKGDPTPGSIFIGRSCGIGIFDDAQVTIFA